MNIFCNSKIFTVSFWYQKFKTNMRYIRYDRHTHSMSTYIVIWF